MWLGKQHSFIITTYLLPFFLFSFFYYSLSSNISLSLYNLFFSYCYFIWKIFSLKCLSLYRVKISFCCSFFSLCLLSYYQFYVIVYDLTNVKDIIRGHLLPLQSNGVEIHIWINYLILKWNFWIKKSVFKT